METRIEIEAKKRFIDKSDFHDVKDTKDGKAIIERSEFRKGFIEGAKYEWNNAFVQGFACALSVLLQYEQQSTAITDEMFKSGIGSIDILKKCHVDKSDIDTITKYYGN